MHVYHPMGAWLVEQNAIPSQIFMKQYHVWLRALLNGTSDMTGIQTHTLLLTTPESWSVELDHMASKWHLNGFTASKQTLTYRVRFDSNDAQLCIFTKVCIIIPEVQRLGFLHERCRVYWYSVNHSP